MEGKGGVIKNPMRKRVKGKIISGEGEIIFLSGIYELAEWGQSPPTLKVTNYCSAITHCIYHHNLLQTVLPYSPQNVTSHCSLDSLACTSVIDSRCVLQHAGDMTTYLYFIYVSGNNGGQIPHTQCAGRQRKQCRECC